VNGDFQANTAKTFIFNSDGTPSGLIPGWVPSGPGVSPNYDNGGSGNEGVEATGNYGGSMHLFLNNLDPSVYQTSAYSIMDGDAFALTLNVGGEWADNGLHNELLSIYYVNGASRVSFASTVISAPQDWAYHSYTLNGVAPVAADGKLVGVEFQEVSSTSAGTSVSWTAFDNVVLGVPEPASIALFGIGGLALLAFRRRA
jgi:hypothetical protein